MSEENKFEIKKNTSYLFINSNKLKDSHPDYNGSANINNTLYSMSAWINKTNNNVEYLSISIKNKDEDIRISEKNTSKNSEIEEKVKNNKGYLIDISSEKKNERQPNLKGEIRAENILYSVAGWKKINRNNNEFYSLSLKEVDAKHNEMDSYIESQQQKYLNSSKHLEDFYDEKSNDDWDINDIFGNNDNEEKNHTKTPDTNISKPVNIFEKNLNHSLEDELLSLLESDQNNKTED